MKDLSKSSIAGLIGLVVMTYLASILVGTIRRNNELQGEITSLNKEIIQLKDDQTELSYKVHYYQTDEFKDKEARAKLGLMKEGESLLILPSAPATTTSAGTQTASPAFHKSNLALWIDFLSGKEAPKL
jgi:cell division protein FtsB